MDTSQGYINQPCLSEWLCHSHEAHQAAGLNAASRAHTRYMDWVQWLKNWVMVGEVYLRKENIL